MMVSSRPYRFPEHETKIVQKEMAERLKMRKTEEPQRVWCSPKMGLYGSVLTTMNKVSQLSHAPGR